MIRRISFALMLAAAVAACDACEPKPVILQPWGVGDAAPIVPDGGVGACARACDAIPAMCKEHRPGCYEACVLDQAKQLGSFDPDCVIAAQGDLDWLRARCNICRR